jgi:hypothetical protein
VKWKVWTKILLIFFLTADLFGNMGFYGKEETSNYFQKTRILEMITSDKGNFRTVSTGKTISADTPVLIADTNPLTILKEKHHPSMNLLYSLHDVWGVDVIRLKRVDDLYKAFTSTPPIYATQFINLYGVKYIVSVTPLEGNNQLELIYARLEGLQGKRKDLLQENTIKLYKNRSPILRGWLVKDFKVMDSEAVLSRITSKDFNPDKEVLLEEEPRWEEQSLTPARAKESIGLPKSRVEFISETNNRLLLTVEAQEKAFLVLNDTYFPGWQAFVDGKRTKIYRADYTFRTIPLNAGTHCLEFVYDPMSFKLGAGVTLLGILGCIGMGWVARRKRRV